MILPYFIITPLLAAFLITLIAGKMDKWGILLSMLAEIILTFLAVYSFIAFRTETLVYQMGGWKIPYGIVLVQDALACYMLLIVNFIALVSLLYSVNYIRNVDSDWKYYALFMLLLSGMNGVILTGDLFNLFVFMEIALLAAFALVAYGGKAEEYEAAFKYAVMGAVSSTLILIGITVVYSSTSVLTLAAVADVLSQRDPKIIHWIGSLLLVGFGLKAAAMPFHAWLPDAHSSAPAPISSMLSGVLIKVLGIYVLVRLFFNVLGAPDIFIHIFLVLSAISILIAGFMSVNQWDMKRLLAYSSISQIGYILLGLGIATPLGILGAVFHVLNHALFKSLLFFNAGTVEMMLGTRDLHKMGNLTKPMPLTSGTSLVASLAISGIPPFNGFFSKLIIIIAAIQAGYPLYAIIAILGSILTMGAVMKIQRYGFRGERKVDVGDKKVNWKMNTAMITLAILCLVTSVLIIPGIRETTFDPVVAVITEKTQYIQAVMGR